MSRWFRHYAGMMRDDKLVRVAIRSGQAIERVVWVYGAILESAAEIDEDGRYDFDAAEAAYFLRAPEDDILAIERELENAGRLDKGVVAKWGDRQFSSDRSAERQRRYRERQKTAKPDDSDGQPPQRQSDDDNGVTSPSRHSDAPETELELDTEDTPLTPRKRGGSGRTLLPEDWELPIVADLPPQARACAEQWTSASYAAHGEAFKLYWRSERKMKADWRGTWANRVIALHSQVMRDQKFGNAAPAAKSTTPAKSPEEWAATCLSTAKHFEDRGDMHSAAEWRRKAGVRTDRPPGGPRAIGDLVQHMAGRA